MTSRVSQRLYSLDALRGFDMFWIMGAEEIFHKLATITKNGFWQVLSDQFRHPDWHGFSAYDLIFPLFLFLACVAAPYSLGKQIENGKTKRQLLQKIIQRGLLLVILGIIYNNGLELRPIAEVRFGSVLSRIGLAYLFANVICLYFSERSQMIWTVGLLIGYWLLFLFGSAPGYPSGDFTMQGNIVSYLDTVVMPGKLYLGIHDPEGVVSTIPAIATGLLGVYTGNLLKNSSLDPMKKVVRMVIIGIAFLSIAQLWNLAFPINKNLWTSSFVLQAGGLSFLLMALFYYSIDILGYRKWAFFFKVIGMNSILIYMSWRFISWSYANEGFFKWLEQAVGEPYGAFVLVFTNLGLQWLFLYFLYKKKFFLRV